MSILPLDDILVRPIIDHALAEDLGRAGDITGQACIDPDTRLSVVWASRQDGRVSGLSCARLSLAALDPTARFEVVTPDGSDVQPGTVLARAEGNARAVLAAERTGLNLLGRLSGVATRGVTVFVYVWSGLMAGLAGVIVAADIQGADANNAGLWLELDAILAAVIGGISLFGGRFSLSRVILGALTLQALKTGILLSGLPPEMNLVVMALVVAVVLVLQAPAVSERIERLRLKKRVAA